MTLRSREMAGIAALALCCALAGPVLLHAGPAAAAEPFAVAQAETSQRLDPEEEAWAAVKDSKDPQVLKDFRSAFPDGRFARAARLRERALRREQGQPPAAPGGGEPTAKQWYDKADTLWQNNKYADPRQAIQYLNEAIRVDPAMADAWNDRGTAYAQLGQPQQAIENFDQAIRLAPSANKYLNRGIEYGNLKQSNRAIEDYNRAIEINPKFARAYFNRAAAYTWLDNWSAARADWKRACDLKYQPGCDSLAENPEGQGGASGKPAGSGGLTAQQWYDKADALWQNGRYTDLQAALHDLDEAIRLDPRMAAAWNDRGNVYDIMGDYPHAIENYNEAIRLEPGPWLYVNRGTTYSRMKQHDRAIADYNQAIAMDTNFGRAYFNRGVAYTWLDNMSQARIDVQRACGLKYQPACDWLAKNPER